MLNHIPGSNGSGIVAAAAAAAAASSAAGGPPRALASGIQIRKGAASRSSKISSFSVSDSTISSPSAPSELLEPHHDDFFSPKLSDLLDLFDRHTNKRPKMIK